MSAASRWPSSARVLARFIEAGALSGWRWAALSSKGRRRRSCRPPRTARLSPMRRLGCRESAAARCGRRAPPAPRVGVALRLESRPRPRPPPSPRRWPTITRRAARRRPAAGAQVFQRAHAHHGRSVVPGAASLRRVRVVADRHRVVPQRIPAQAEVLEHQHRVAGLQLAQHASSVPGRRVATAPWRAPAIISICSVPVRAGREDLFAETLGRRIDRTGPPARWRARRAASGTRSGERRAWPPARRGLMPAGGSTAQCLRLPAQPPRGNRGDQQQRERGPTPRAITALSGSSG